MAVKSNESLLQKRSLHSETIPFPKCRIIRHNFHRAQSENELAKVMDRASWLGIVKVDV